jgi:N-acetylglucosaminyl-diphospho-decaprenol L-rhamnosyltransferase
MKTVAPVAPALYPPAPARSAPIPHLRRGLSPASPRLSIIIVNYRSWEETARLVSQIQSGESLRRGTAEVIVVDNHSPPHPLARRLRRAEGVSLRRWGRNRGFGRAVNEGVRLGRGQWFLLLNPDVTVDPGFLDGVLALVDRLDRDSEGPGMPTGVVGLGVDNPDGSRQPSTGPFPTLAGTLTRLLLPRPWRKCHFFSPRNEDHVPWATGCCLLLRRGVLEDLGGFDPGFFLYYEDVDLCRRASAGGWTVRHEPSLRAVHHAPLHSRPVRPHLRLLTRHSLLLYAFKHWSRWQQRLLARLVQAEAWLKSRCAALRGDVVSARLFAELGALAAEMRRGECTAAHRRLQRVVHETESNL